MVLGVLGGTGERSQSVGVGTPWGTRSTRRYLRGDTDESVRGGTGGKRVGGSGSNRSRRRSRSEENAGGRHWRRGRSSECSLKREEIIRCQ